MLIEVSITVEIVLKFSVAPILSFLIKLDLRTHSSAFLILTEKTVLGTEKVHYSARVSHLYFL